MSIRILIVDDQALVRAGFRLVLESEKDFEILGEAGDGQEAVEAAGRLRPDVILMDVRMPRVDGLEATRRILSNGSNQPRVVMLTTFDLDEYVYAALQAGACGFLLKDVTPEHLIDAVRIVRKGDALLAPSITRRLVERYAARAVRPLKDLDSLTDREADVLRWMARGLANQEIAEKLFVSEATVKTHVAHILDKLGIENRVQAVIAAYESGMVTLGS